MWVFCKDGFFSVVQHNTDANILQIRGRVRADLENLAEAVGYSSEDVFEIAGADYLYRINLPRGTFGGYMLEAVDELTYTTNVKGTLSGDDKERGRAMMGVWDSMARLQPVPPYAGGPDQGFAVMDDDFSDLADDADFDGVE